MKRFKVLLAGLLLALPVLAWVTVAHAQSIRTGSTVTVAAGSTLDSTLYAAGQTLDIAGTVNGDVFCAGQSVTISGTINGDVICAAQTITISGRVDGDVRAAGQSVSLNGEITRNATVMAQSLTTDSKARINGDLTLLGQGATLHGTIGRDIAGSVEDLTVGGQVGRNISATISRLTLGSSTTVGGGIYYASHNELSKQQGAKVNGQVTRTEPKSERKSWMSGFEFHLWFALSMLVLALALVLVAPRVFNYSAVIARQSLGKTFLIGLLASLVAQATAIVLMLTIVGIPLGVLVFLMWLVVAGLAGPFAAYLTGRLLWRSGTNAVLLMLLGAVTLLVVMMIPVINVLVFLVVFWFGTGMVIRLLWRLLGDHSFTVAPVPVSKKRS